MSCYFPVNSQKQNTLEDTAAMCCFLMFESSLQTRWRKIISLPDKNISSIRIWHYRHNEMFIRSSYRPDTTTRYVTLLSIVMYLVQLIQVKKNIVMIIEKNTTSEKVLWVCLIYLEETETVYYHKETMF